MKKILIFALYAICGVVIIYLLIDSGSASGILATYNNVKPQSSSSHGKQLQFLRSYSLQTNDFTVASMILGMSPDDAQGALGGGSGSGGGGGNTVGPVGFTTSMTPDGWKDALNKRGNNYFTVNTGFKLEPIGSTTYLVEKQSDYWSGIKGNGTTATVKSAGCWLFACTNSINNLMGSTYGVNDILAKRDSSDNVEWNGTSNKWTKGKDRRDVGMRGVSVEKSVFNSFGCDITAIAEYNMTAEQAYSKINDAGFNNCVYIIYGHKSGVLSSGSDHWIVVVGLTGGSSNSEKKFQLLGNGSRGTEISINDIGTTSGTINRIYKISKK